MDQKEKINSICKAHASLVQFKISDDGERVLLVSEYRDLLDSAQKQIRQQVGVSFGFVKSEGRHKFQVVGFLPEIWAFEMSECEMVTIGGQNFISTPNGKLPWSEFRKHTDTEGDTTHWTAKCQNHEASGYIHATIFND